MKGDKAKAFIQTPRWVSVSIRTRDEALADLEALQEALAKVEAENLQLRTDIADRLTKAEVKSAKLAKENKWLKAQVDVIIVNQNS